MQRTCFDCESIIEGHFRKRCAGCAAVLKKRPLGNLTEAQEQTVKELAGTMKIKDLAKHVGTSDSTLDRWAYYNNVDINWLSYDKKTIKDVCDYYGGHGLLKTQEAFPMVRVRSIVEKYKLFKPRCRPWTLQERIELVRMAGLVSGISQYKYFKRPRARAGSIWAAYIKTIKAAPTYLNGLPRDSAKHLVTSNARYLKVYGISRTKRRVLFRSMLLWIDLEKHLKVGAPKHLQDSIRACADFQRWIWKDPQPRNKILKMIKEREK